MIRRARRGFTLIELSIALVLLGLLFVKLTLIASEATKAHRESSTEMILEDQAQQVLDRIAYALIGADPESLQPDPQAPLFTSKISYRVSMGVEDGQIIWGDPEAIGLAENATQLCWSRNAETENEQIVIWTRHVAELLEKEFLNGSDDNENGLTDEWGLTFVVDGDSVAIRLTLEKETKEGRTILQTKDTLVTCRN